MDATVIEEIARQLGMAAETAGQFITDILPQYAGLMVLRNGVTAAVFLFLLIACAMTYFCVSKFTKARIEREAKEKEEGRWGRVYAEKDRHFTLMMTAATAGVCAVFFFVIGVSEAMDAVSWALYPEAMLLDMALEKVA